MGEGGSKTAKKIPTSFMDGSIHKYLVIIRKSLLTSFAVFQDLIDFYLEEREKGIKFAFC